MPLSVENTETRMRAALRPLLTVLLTATGGVSCSEASWLMSALHDIRLNDADPLYSLTAATRQRCAVSCLSHSCCVAASWNADSAICQLHTRQSYCRPDGALQEQGWLVMRTFTECPRSCQQLRDLSVRDSAVDGVYHLPGAAAGVYCDMTRDGGGWTLLVSAVSLAGWDLHTVKDRSPDQPSIQDDYSMLGRGDALLALGRGDRFQYRLEAQTQQARRQWGGIWSAPRNYSLVAEERHQTDVIMQKRFSQWTTNSQSIEDRLPWINSIGMVYSRPLLTTSGDDSFWGTLVTNPSYTVHQHSPWIYPQQTESGNILYWVRENEESLQ